MGGQSDAQNGQSDRLQMRKKHCRFQLEGVRNAPLIAYHTSDPVQVWIDARVSGDATRIAEDHFV